MPRILYLDCSSGVSGDMFLGALTGLGYPLEELEKIAAACGLDGEVELSSSEVKRGGIAATQLVVKILHERHHRAWKDIRALLESADLAPAVRARALAMFARLAAVEAQIHGVPVEEVHFHEIGNADTILDITGAAAAMQWLAPDRVAVSPVNVGSGTVHCAHGELPVPAPATAALLMGVPVFSRFDGELTTPTGALLVTEFATGFGPMPLMAATALSVSAGTRQSADHPNVLRAFLGRSVEQGEDPGPLCMEEVIEIQANMDDMNPQVYPFVIERLLDAGARDAYITPVVMKKGRPGHMLHVLCHPEDRAAALDIVLRETTTLGARVVPCTRACLDRFVKQVDTEYGAIRVKIGVLDGLVAHAMPEYEDCAAAARESQAPLRAVMDAAAAAAAALWKPGEPFHE
jgi:uncharacterized protein (TIGR00299 family) protein